MHRTEKRHSIFGISLFRRRMRQDASAPGAGRAEHEEGANAASGKSIHDILRIAIRNGGGLGDSIMDVAFIQNLRRHLPEGSRVDYFAKSAHAFAFHPAIARTSNDMGSLRREEYDAVLTQHRFFIVDRLDEEKVQRLSPVFFEFCQSMRELKASVLNGIGDSNGLYTMYAELLGKNRWEQMDLKAVTGFDRNSPVYMPIAERAFTVLEKYSLEKFRYITVSRGVDRCFDSQCPKLWPLGHYLRFVELFKEAFPGIAVVQIGANEKFGRVGADVCLLGRTDLEESKAVMKNALLHVDVEGGLVHLNHALHGTSLVIFGPTPVKTFGYDRNINLTSSACPGTCHWVTADWQKRCLRGFEEAPCMAATQPEAVLASASVFLKKAMRRASLEKIAPSPLENGKTALVGFRSPEDVPEHILRRNACTFFSDRYEKASPLCASRLGCRYNLMAEEEEFDSVVCRLDASCRTKDFAMEECARVLKPCGRLIVMKGDRRDAAEHFTKVPA